MSRRVKKVQDQAEVGHVESGEGGEERHSVKNLIRH